MPDSVSRKARLMARSRATHRQLAEAIIDLANESVIYRRLSGRRSVITRFEAAVIQLATSQARDRKANLEFIETVLDAARSLEQSDIAEASYRQYLRDAAEHREEGRRRVAMGRLFDRMRQFAVLDEADFPVTPKR